MLVKLTHRGKPTIFNPRQVITMYMDTDLKSGEFKVKITTTSGAVFVDEALNVVHEMFNNAIAGEVPQEYEYDIPTIDERMDRKFNHERSENLSMAELENRYSQRRRQPIGYNRNRFDYYDNR